MMPGSFDPVTSRQVIGDDLARVIEAKARSDADAENYDAIYWEATGLTATYWDAAMCEMMRVVYHAQYAKRVARNKRKALDSTINKIAS